MIDELINEIEKNFYSLLTSNAVIYYNEYKLKNVLITTLRAHLTHFINEIDKINLKSRLYKLENDIENIKENCVWKPLYDYKTNSYIEITTNDIKYLREETGAGLNICKEALLKANGNKEDALIYIKQKGYV